MLPLTRDITPEDFFPIVQQTLQDAFGLESFLMKPPYSDFDRFDRGLRRMIWGTYSTSGPVFSLSGSSRYEIIVLESTLDFYNIAVTLDETDTPALGCIMPFRTEVLSQSDLLRIVCKNNIPPNHTLALQQFYSSLPIVDLQMVVRFLQHLITAFLPAFSESRIEYVDYRSEHHDVQYDNERFQSFSADYAEEFKKRLLSFLEAVASGDPGKAVDQMKSLTAYSMISTNMSVAELQNQLSGINAFLIAKMMDTSVHPLHVLQQGKIYEMKIRNAASEKELLHFPIDMARKYALLVRNYGYERYSYLIRNVINYIDQHLSGELTLAILAAEFGKNPSYLSGAFKKETGDTITGYISKQRVQASLRYFNTTNLSVAEVAIAVGIQDFSYFTKLFRRYVGVSPREYRKMLDR